MVLDPHTNKHSTRNRFSLNFRILGWFVLATTIIVIGTEVFSWEEEQEKLRKQVERYDEAEQYVLIAAMDGWYTCCNCNSDKVFLHAGEAWKYGSTIKKKRYSDAFLEGQKLEYIVELEGDLTICRKKEMEKIRMYKFSSENIRRSVNKRLIRPPGNCKNY